MGPGDQRDRRQDARDPRQVRRRFRLSARLREILQRRRLSVPQVRGVLGHQLDRPPGPHLPFHHRRRRRQYLGLRRDDQFLQRHAQLEDHRLHGIERRRSASGVAAAHPDRQGDQPRQRVRARPALHPHRGPRHRICPVPQRHRHRGDLGHAAPHLQQWLGRQGIHQAARLRHGPDPRRSREVDAGRGRARHRDSRRAAEEGRRDLRQAEAVGLCLVHGRHPAHRRHRQRPRLLQPAAGDRQCRHLRRRRQHLPRPLQRAGRDRYRSRYRDAAALLRPGRRRLEALGARLGSRIRLSAVALRRSAGEGGPSGAHPQAEHGIAGHPVDPLVRCDAGQP